MNSVFNFVSDHSGKIFGFQVGTGVLAVIEKADILFTISVVSGVMLIVTKLPEFVRSEYVVKTTNWVRKLFSRS